MRQAAALRRASLLTAAVSVVSLVSVGAPPASAAQQQTLSGSCQFSGPIEPNPPITVIPKPGAHFSYAGTGTCSGTLDGTSVAAAPTTVTFTNVSTLFDTCELGPDFNLLGTMTVSAGTVTANFPITIDLARLAVAGPFLLTTPGGGQAAGVAQFTPPNEATAIQQCATSGLSTATLSANFTILSPLTGTEPVATGAHRAHLAVRWRHSRLRRHAGHKHHRRASA